MMNLWRRAVPAMMVVVFGCGESVQIESAIGAEPEVADVVQPVVATVPADVDQRLLEDVVRARDLISDWEGSPEALNDARAIILSVLKTDRDFAPAYVELARLEYKGGYLSGDDFDRTRLINADKFTRKALELDPELPEAHLTMAVIAMYLGEYDRTDEALATAVSLGLASWEAEAIRAHLAIRQGNDAEALRMSRDLLARDEVPDARKAGLLDMASAILERGGFREEAREMHARRIAIRPDGPWGHGNFAAFLLRHGETDLALKHAKQAVEIMPYGMGLQILARAYITRAEEFHRQGEFARAGAVIDEMSRALGTTSPDTMEFLGNYYYGIFVRTNDLAYLRQAEESFARAVELDSNRESAVDALKRVRERMAS